MSDFTKTLIVDPDITLNGTYPTPPYFNTIKQAADELISSGSGGTIIVEQGTYEIDGTTGKETVEIPSNVTIIGRGNVMIEVTADVSAFKNADQTNGNEHIRIEGFNKTSRMLLVK